MSVSFPGVSDFASSSWQLLRAIPARSGDRAAVGARGGRFARIWLVPIVVLTVAGMAPARAGDWTGDFNPGEWRIATLEVSRSDYLEAEKVAVGCSEGVLFVERYSPAGARPRSTLVLSATSGAADEGTTVTIVWERLDAPNSMWAYGATARAVIVALLTGRQVAFEELAEPARRPVLFDLAGARAAIGPVLSACGGSDLMAAEPMPTRQQAATLTIPTQ